MQERWQTILQTQTLTTAEIIKICGISKVQFEQIHERFPVRVNRELLKNDSNPGSPILQQFLPDLRELTEQGQTDPLLEECYRQGITLIHRYPNRILFLVSNVCASYCRYCTRRRQVGRSPNPSPQEIEAGIRYIAAHPEVNEVILSGGDPLLLQDSKIVAILQKLRGIGHVQLIRVSTRTLGILPQRITTNLVKIFQRHHPLIIITQFNHPDEFSVASDRAIKRLIDHGIPVLNQSVLLKGINADREVMLALVQKLVQRRIRPYYLHQLDPVKGTLHFETPIERGREIIAFLRKKIGGHAIPQYVTDDPAQEAKTLLAY